MSCPFLELRIWPILVAFAASVLLGVLWYSPWFLGSLWLRLRDRRIEEYSREELRRPLMLSLLVPGLISVTALAVLLDWTGVGSVLPALVVASLVCLGFSVPALLVPIFAEGRSIRLNLIYFAYIFCALNLSAIILIVL